MSDISVGVISLDLVIKNKISEQIQGMKGSIAKQLSNALESSAAEASDKLKTGLEKTAESAGAAARRAVQSTMSQAEGAVKAQCERVSYTVQKAFEGFELSSDPTVRLKQQLENTYEKMGTLQKRWQELQASLDSTNDDDVAAKLTDQLNAVESRLLSLQGTAERTSAKLSGETDKLSQAAQAYEEKLQALKEQNAARIEAIEQKAAARVEQINAKTAAMKEQYEAKAAADKEQSAARLEGIESAYQQRIEGLQVKNADLRERLARKSAGSIKKHLSGAFKSIGSISGKALDGLRGKLSKINTSVSSMSKPVSKLGNMIKNAARRIFVMAGVLMLLKNIRSALSEAVKGNEDFASSLNEIKANLSIAFKPIIDAAMPAINALMSGLAAATRQLAEFTNQLFGTTYKKSLEAVKKIKEVGKEAKKNSSYLNSYDVMNVAQSTDSSDSSSSDSGIDYSAINGDGVKLTDWAQRMKDAIKAGDWSGVGALLAEKVNGVFAAVDWEKIRGKAKAAADGIADIFNGFVRGINWSAAGKSIGEGVNTIFATVYELLDRIDFEGFGSSVATGLNSSIKAADFSLVGKTFAKKWNAIIDTLHGFVTTFDFKGLGKGLSDSVNAWFSEVDFSKAGATLSEGIKGILDTGIAFLQNTNWKSIGEKLWTFIKNIDWGGIAAKSAEALGSAFGAAAALIWGFIKEAWSKVVKWWNETAYKDGKFTVSGLLNGILDKIKGIGAWIKEKIFQPFINGFKKAFGIASPSKIMKDMGGYIISGLYNGIFGGIEKIKKICSDLLSAIKGVFKNIGSWFEKKFDDAVAKIKKVFDPMTIAKTFANAKNAIISVFASIPKWFKDKFTEAWTNVKNVFSKGGKIFAGITSGIAETFKSIVNKLIGGINDVIAFPFEKINDMLNSIHDISIFGAKPFSSLWDKDPLPIPEIPKLAKGGLATAPTLAMVGDNKNARVDPEVISPLSKLKSMMTQGNSADLSEIRALLRAILEAIREGKLINLYLAGKGVRLLTSEVVNEINDIIASTGHSPINL